MTVDLHLLYSSGKIIVMDKVGVTVGVLAVRIVTSSILYALSEVSFPIICHVLDLPHDHQLLCFCWFRTHRKISSASALLTCSFKGRFMSVRGALPGVADL